MSTIMLKKTAMVFLFYFFIISKPLLYGTIYGAVSGIVVEDETNKPIPGVEIRFEGRERQTILTGKDGDYICKLKPGKYSITFLSKFSYCCLNHSNTVNVKSGETITLNKVFKKGGTITGKVFKNNKSTPLSNVNLFVFARNFGSAQAYSKSDGSFLLGEWGGLCPADTYLLTVSSGIDGIADKIMQRISIMANKNTIIDDIVFDLTDTTGIEGVVTSSIDGTPLKGVSVNIGLSQEIKKTGNSPDIAEIDTDENGNYSISNMEPGNYYLYFLPPIKNNISYSEYDNLCKSSDNVIVEKGKKTKVNIKLNVKN